MSWLATMRAKSNGVKNRTAAIIAAAITLAVVGVWIWGIRSARTDEATRANSSADDLKPLFMIFKKAGKDIKSVKSNTVVE